MTKRNTQPTGPGLIAQGPAYAPMSPTEAAAELGVPLSQRLRPDLANHVPKRFVPKAEAAARGWSLYWTGEACRFGHQGARKISNDGYCTDCYRIRSGQPAIYPQSRAQEFYSAPTPKAEGAAAPVITAPAAPPEPSTADQKFLAKLDELRDFDAAAAAVGTKRGLIEARASSNQVFRAALTDLCDRRGIAWTRAPDSEFKWTLEVERQFTRRFIDCGLLEQTRQEMGVSASDYQTRLSTSSKFAELIEEARPLARETLRERAMVGAATGNDRLAKILEDDPEVGIFTDFQGNKRRHVNPQQARTEMSLLLDELRKKLGRREALAKAARDARERSNTSPAASNDDLVTA